MSTFDEDDEEESLAERPEDRPKQYPTVEQRLERLERAVALCARAITEHNLADGDDKEALEDFWEVVLHA